MGEIMAKRKIQKKGVGTVQVGELKLGYAFPSKSRGPPAGKTVRFEFKEKVHGEIRTRGTLDVGGSMLYWQGPGRKIWAIVPTDKLEELFEDYY